MLQTKKKTTMMFETKQKKNQRINDELSLSIDLFYSSSSRFLNIYVTQHLPQ